MKKIFKTVLKKDVYDHHFGGTDWITPICDNCNNHYHQILSLDLCDPRLSSIMGECDKQFPIVSCLNCSSCWDEQVYKINFEKKEVLFISNTDEWHICMDEDSRIDVPLLKQAVSLEEKNYDGEYYYNFLDDIGTDFFLSVLGEPCFLYHQANVNLKCPFCQKEMRYIATLCSDYNNIIKDINFNIGENMLYFLFCSKCDIVKVLGQST